MSPPKQSKPERAVIMISAKRIGGKEVTGKQRRTRQGESKGGKVESPHAEFNGMAQQSRVLVGGLRMDRSILFSGYKTFELLERLAEG